MFSFRLNQMNIMYLVNIIYYEVAVRYLGNKALSE